MEPEDPKVIGRYQVLKRLGAGAMGVVYLAQDPLLKRRVAVKVVQTARADSDAMVQRFQRESEISAQLNHPNIITVFDVGEDPQAGPFLTMEFVDGASLGACLRQGRPDAATALDWLCQLGQALVCAERAGVVHRDVKPENVLVSRDAQVKLTDFGLARDDDSSMTRTGAMMGTPTHTAPELLGGERATAATDRWAFSVLAFQLCLGALPHPGETLSAVLHAIANDPPAFPEGTPAPLVRVFLKALHKDPARRYDSILAFLTALAQALGIPEKLAPRGLTPPEASPGPGETEAFTLPEASPPAATAALPPRASAPGAPPPGASPRASARLTGPPPELLRGASGERQAGRSSGDTPSRRSGSNPIGLVAAPTRSHPKGWTPVLTPVARPFPRWIPGTAAVLALAAAFFLFPRSLAVRTVPDGARILVDGREVGTSPYRGSTTFGSHMLEVRQEGYDTLVRQFTPGDSPLVLTLAPTTSWVDILTVPPGAQVILEGRSLGPSPCRGVPVPDHPAPLAVNLRGYRPWSGTLGPGSRPPQPIHLKRG